MSISFEEAVSRCWAEVDLTRLVTNYRNALAHLRPGVRLICVLKADAYGLGAPVVAERLWREGQRLFAVASYNEAAQLRRALPDCEVLILGLVGQAQLPAAIRAGMLLTVFSERYALAVTDASAQVALPARVHFKVETGLNRLGLAPALAPEIITRALEGGHIRMEGLFTHLALRAGGSPPARPADRLPRRAARPGHRRAHDARAGQHRHGALPG